MLCVTNHGSMSLKLTRQDGPSVHDLLEALGSHRGQWEDLKREDLETLIHLSKKQRFEIIADKIRALNGYSLSRNLFKGNEMIWLSDSIPAHFIRLPNN